MIHGTWPGLLWPMHVHVACLRMRATRPLRNDPAVNHSRDDRDQTFTSQQHSQSDGLQLQPVAHHYIAFCHCASLHDHVLPARQYIVSDTTTFIMISGVHQVPLRGQAIASMTQHRTCVPTSSGHPQCWRLNCVADNATSKSRFILNTQGMYIS